MRECLLAACLVLCTVISWAQPNYTANDRVVDYDGPFRSGVNLGVFPPWTDEQLGDLAAGNEALEVPGIGARTIRPALFEHFVEEFGYDFRVPAYEHYDNIGLKDMTLIVGFPTHLHRDPTEYCPGVQSELFSNLYLPIWDNGENGTPVNDQNYYALYIYKLVKHYGPYIRFWEIWNEPGFDYTGLNGWLQPGEPGNWWDNNPDPCDYKLKAPIYHYIRILRISWEVIKSEAPEDYVLVSGVGFPSFLDAILRNTDNPTGAGVTPEYPLTGGAYFDVMGYHAYPHFDGSLQYWDNNIQNFAYTRHSDAAADGLITAQEQFREVLDRYGYNGQQYPRKHWMITEFNTPRKAFGTYIGSEESQRNFMSKAVVKTMMNDFLQIHVYKIGEDAEYDIARDEFDVMGLYQKLEGVDPYFATPNQSGVSYKTTSDLLNEMIFDEQYTLGMKLPPNVDGGAFRDQFGNYTYVLWAKTKNDRSEQANAVYSFPSFLNLGQLVRREWDYSDTRSQWIVDAKSIKLTGAPSFFTTTRFSMDRSSGCGPLTINFVDHAAQAGGTNRRWTFEGGTPAASTDGYPQVTFSEAGEFEVRLDVLDDNDNIIASQASIVFVEKAPEASFDSHHSGPLVVFSNTSTQNPTSYQWNFGDGTSSDDPNPTHVYLQSGTYTATLRVENDCGQDIIQETFEVVAPTTSKIPYTAKDQVPVYTGKFRPGTNMGAYNGWTDEQLANIAAGNVLEGVEGINAKAVRPILDERFLDYWGYDIRLDAFQHYINVDLKDNTLMVGFPTEAHRDPNFYCANQQSELFANMYLDIWDNGENGTPINEENYYASYLYQTVLRYKDNIKFWEIWNEPSFDYVGNGWKQPGLAGNWWENDPNPCDYKLRAPIYHFVRLLRISYEVIKHQDPEGMVTLSGVAFPSFLDAVLRNTDNPKDGSVAPGYENGGGAYFDVMGFHSYPHFDGSTRYYDQNIGGFVYERNSDASIRGMATLQDTFTSLLSEYGYNGQTYPAKYWIVTEANVPRKPFGQFMGGVELQRNYTIKTYVQAVRRDFKQLHFYKIAEDDYYWNTNDEFNVMGLYQKLDDVQPYNQTINDQGIAFKTTSELLYGTDYDLDRTKALNMPATVDGAAFRDANGNYIYVLWAITQQDQSEFAQATYNFPSWIPKNLKMRKWNYSFSNQESTISSQGVPLTGEPIFLLESNQTIQPPIAAFSAAQTEGCIPFKVKYTDHSVRADRIEWSFEGGTPANSTQRNPQITYETPGIYNVAMRVYNAAGDHTATYTKMIRVRDVRYDGDFTFQVDGNWLELYPTLPYSDEITYHWTFGDGYFTGSQNPRHFYFANGQYTVTMTIFNDCGSHSVSKVVNISNTPLADFTKTVQTACPPHEVQFYDLTTSNPTSWYWEFPGGSPAVSTEQNPTVAYSTGGDYQAMLIANNSYGADTMYTQFTLADGIESFLTLEMCTGEQVVVNGTVYDQNNPSGTETILQGSVAGCDSVVFVQLEYFDDVFTQINRTLCHGEEIWINNVRYDVNNPSGMETLTGASQHGCDSTVQIQLDFRPEAVETIRETVCPGTVYLVNGVFYDQTNPQGTEVFLSGAASGCDSTVHIDLTYHPEALTSIKNTFCEGESIIINGVRYDADNPAGTEIINGASTNGCDSIVNIDLTFLSESAHRIEREMCMGSQLTVGGEIFDINRPTGQVIISGGNAGGCDSTITVSLTYVDSIQTNMVASICGGDVYDFNGQQLTEFGTYRSVLQSQNGCDSVVVLSLDVIDNPIRETEELELCAGETYNGVEVYADLVVIDTFESYQGCDSLYYTFITVHEGEETSIDARVCSGRLYHGVPYFNDTTILEYYNTVEQCDSIVRVFIDVVPNSETFLNDTILLGDSYLFGDESLTEAGIYTQNLYNVQGCDSLVQLTLVVLTPTSDEEAWADDFSLQAMPNPFTRQLAVEFVLPRSSEVQLELIDLHGRVLRQIILDPRHAPGEHRYDLRVSDLAAGVYYARLRVDGQMETVKVVKVE